MQEEQAGSHCPVKNLCAISGDEYPECGGSIEHLPPLVMAEELCPRALIGVSEAIRTHRRSAANAVRLGWFMLERAMVDRTDILEALHFQEARDHFDHVQDDAAAPALQRWRARHALNYLPAFRERKHLGYITPDTVNQRYYQLGGELTRLIAERTDTNDKSGQWRGMLAELAFAGLLLRTGRPEVFPFAASTREEAGIGLRGTPGHHHDYYLLNGKKRPVQVKWRNDMSKASLEKVGRIRMSTVIYKAGTKLFPGKMRTEVLDRLASAMVVESRSHAVENRTQEALRIATDTVLTLLEPETEY